MLQSLTLWREVTHDMFKLWILAEDDLLESGNNYRLKYVFFLFLPLFVLSLSSSFLLLLSCFSFLAISLCPQTVCWNPETTTAWSAILIFPWLYLFPFFFSFLVSLFHVVFLTRNCRDTGQGYNRIQHAHRISKVIASDVLFLVYFNNNGRGIHTYYVEFL